MKKRWLVLLICFIMAVTCLAACGGSQKSDSGSRKEKDDDDDDDDEEESKSSKKNSQILCVKDKEIMLYDQKDNKFVQITTKLVKDSSIDKGDLSYFRSGVMLSKDGKYLLFPDKVDASGWTLYCRNLGNLNEEPIEVDSDVDTYEINDASTIVTYLKDSGDLWQFDLKKGERAEKKIAKDISDFYVSDDGNQIYYVRLDEDDDKQLWYWTQNGDEKLDSEIDYVSKVSEDFKTIYYVKYGKLYKKVGNNDKETIANGVEQVCRIFDNGAIYYVKSDDDYYEYSLHYFDGKNDKEVFADIESNYYSSADGRFYLEYLTGETDTPAIVFSKGEEAYYVAIKDQVIELDYDDMSIFGAKFDPKDKFFVFMADRKGDYGTLYKATISGSSVKVEAYDDEVYAVYIPSYSITSDGKIKYFKECKNNVGDLYCDKKMIDSEVFVDASYDDNLKGFIYYADYNGNERYGTLKISKEGKPKSIAEEVCDYYVLPNGNVLYLTDYKNYEGDLYLYKGDKSVKIDEDVTSIIRVD